jgi:hypothetical protein
MIILEEGFVSFLARRRASASMQSHLSSALVSPAQPSLGSRLGWAQLSSRLGEVLRVYRDAANVGCSGHVTSEVRLTRVERYPRSKQ